MVDQKDKFDAANPADYSPDELYTVAPPDPELEKSRPAFDPIIPEVVHEDEPRQATPLIERFDFESLRENFHFQFTLADLFILTTASAVLLGVMRMVAWKWQYAAGLGGIGAFISLIIITYVEPERRIAKTIWWSIMTFYLLACLAAMITGK
ncbi:MAG: hypothetical protein JXM70_22055 [Pirellulales bacterium]|nr:hypothetical protein [Pirellulales bacterium]